MQYRFPNQSMVVIKKELLKKSEPWLSINNSVLANAAADLKAGAFKLYVYLASNKNNFELAISPVAVKEEYGIKPDQYKTAKKELIEKGYLVQNEDGKNNFVFYETPRKKV